jgi:hypothetical protein
MKKLRPALGFLILLIVTLTAGWLHGSLSNRWGPRPDAKVAADLFRRELAPEVGNWRMRKESVFEPEVLRILQCPAYISRVYEHQQTGDVVTVMVIVGPPGPVSVHTPEVCYPSQDYTLGGKRRLVPIKDTQGTNHAFWEVALKGNSLVGEELHVMYGWSRGDIWEAHQHPRFGYGGLTHLYKLQLAVPANQQPKGTDFDPSQDFLVNFLPQLKPFLIESSR